MLGRFYSAHALVIGSCQDLLQSECCWYAGKTVDVYSRKQALTFLHVCLASVLNLRSPDDSQLPGSQLDKLVEMLFGDQARYSIYLLDMALA